MGYLRTIYSPFRPIGKGMALNPTRTRVSQAQSNDYFKDNFTMLKQCQKGLNIYLTLKCWNYLQSVIDKLYIFLHQNNLF
jgi:hypothetical protein